MSWLKDAINDLYKLIMSLSLKARTILVAMIIISVAGYFFYKESHSYKLELARIEHSQPSKSDKKIIGERTMAGRIDKDEPIIKAKSTE